MVDLHFESLCLKIMVDRSGIHSLLFARLGHVFGAVEHEHIRLNIGFEVLEVPDAALEMGVKVGTCVRRHAG